jgi:hypothetical protein
MSQVAASAAVLVITKNGEPVAEPLPFATAGADPIGMGERGRVSLRQTL